MRTTRIILALSCLAASAAMAEVVRIEVEDSGDIANGKPYGLAGAYERIAGTIHYAVDPGNRINRTITDIEYAPVNAAGLVEFSADFYLIKPKKIEAGNGAVFFEVANRGRKGLLTRFNRAAGSVDPSSAEHIGDGFLLRQGFSLLWVGWQHDTPEQDGLLRVYPPIATDDGKPIEGLVRSDVIVTEKTFARSLGDRSHSAYPVANPDDPRNVLTVRDGAMGERRVISRDRWQFGRSDGSRTVPDNTMISLDTGFEPGQIYEVVYVAEDPPLAGLGLAAIRDAISMLKYGSPGTLAIPDGAIDRAITYGSSQSGRLLRTYLYDGFNEDEQGRKVFDGVMAHIGGAARGSFNQRFAQPSRAPGGAFEYPNRVFPFADDVQTDPATGMQDGLLSRVTPKSLPKIFYTNSSTEYWRSVSALTHTTVDGERDLPLMDNVRLYHFAGTQHGPARFPAMAANGGHAPNPNEYAWFLRGLLVAMDRWIVDETLPPPSRYATLEKGTLVDFDDLSFPAIPGVHLLPEPSIAYALDYGPQLASKGIITREPPELGPAYPFLVPQVDDSGNEIGGLRSPDIAVPLASYTGWLPSNPVSGVGLYVPFARTRAEREANGDPRLSIEERYQGRAQYLGLVAHSAMALIDDGYLLAGDLPQILERAGAHWDHRISEGDE